MSMQEDLDKATIDWIYELNRLQSYPPTIYSDPISVDILANFIRKMFND
jgi:hypothetical protein